MDEPTPLPPPRLEPEMISHATTPSYAPPAPYLDLPPAPTGVVAAPPSPADTLQASVTGAVTDALHKLDLVSYLELLARTEPRTFRQWVEMALPKQSRQGTNQAVIVNMHSALPKSPLDDLPPGFDLHR